MNKHAPLLRPRRGNNGANNNDDVAASTSRTSSVGSSYTFKQSNRNKGSNKNSILVVLIVLCLFTFYVIIGKPNTKSNLEQNNANVISNSQQQGIVARKDDGEELQQDSNYSPDYHLIFSTDCSAFQHWQSYMMFHSALKVNQPGTITRIASGCSDEEAKTATEWHKDHVTDVMGERFKLHLTPHFSGVKDKDGNTIGDYKFFNKPFGLLHWLENAIGFEEGSSEKMQHPNDVVILIDPDMILLRPITGDFSNPRDVVISKVHTRQRKYYVKPGAPFAQKYGLGTQWRTFDLDEIAGPDSPAKNVDEKDAAAFYPVGPPYIATVKDMYQIARKWTEFVPRVHKQYPYLLAEMFAFCIAAAHLELKHQLIDSLMISNVGVDRGEGWPMVDAITKDTVPSLCEFASQPDHSQHPVPSVIHYCQRYAIGKFFFGKRRMVKDFFECETPLMEFPPMDIIETTNYKHIYNDKRKDLTTKMARREGFMTCAVLGALNDAGTFFKEHSCNGEGNMDKTTNINKK